LNHGFAIRGSDRFSQLTNQGRGLADVSSEHLKGKGGVPLWAAAFGQELPLAKPPATGSFMRTRDIPASVRQGVRLLHALIGVSGRNRLKPELRESPGNYCTAADQ
jgi:hypothetical protein